MYCKHTLGLVPALFSKILRWICRKFADCSLLLPPRHCRTPPQHHTRIQWCKCWWLVTEQDGEGWGMVMSCEMLGGDGWWWRNDFMLIRDDWSFGFCRRLDVLLKGLYLTSNACTHAQTDKERESRSPLIHASLFTWNLFDYTHQTVFCWKPWL